MDKPQSGTVMHACSHAAGNYNSPSAVWVTNAVRLLLADDAPDCPSLHFSPKQRDHKSINSSSAANRRNRIFPHQLLYDNHDDRDCDDDDFPRKRENILSKLGTSVSKAGSRFLNVRKQVRSRCVTIPGMQITCPTPATAGNNNFRFLSSLPLRMLYALRLLLFFLPSITL